MDGRMDGLMIRRRAIWMEGRMKEHTVRVLAHDLTLKHMEVGANCPPMYLLLLAFKLFI